MYTLFDATIKLVAETVEGTSLALERVHHIHRHHSLASRMLSVSDRIANDRLQEHLENIPRLLVDQTRDTFHTTPASQTTNGRLRDTLDVIPQHLAMTLGPALSKTLATLSTARHVEIGW